MQSQLLSLKQLADHVGWPITRIRNLITRKEIRHVRIGGGLFLPSNAIDEYLAANMVEPTGKSIESLSNLSKVG